MDEVKKATLEDKATLCLNHAFEDLEAAKLTFNNELYNASCNRAYYAVYHTIRAVLALDNKEFKQHGETIGYYRHEFLKTEYLDRACSDTIKATGQLRTSCDYDDFYDASREEVEKVITLAESFYSYNKQYIDERICGIIGRYDKYKPL